MAADHRVGRPWLPCSIAVVMCEWDAARDRVIASPTLPAVYGVMAIERVSQGMVLVHPNDIDQHQACVHEAVERGRGYHSSFRIIQPNTGQSRGDRRTG